MKKLKNFRYTVSIIVFCIVLATTLLSIGTYYVFIFLGLIPKGTVLSLWVPIIIIAVCNLVGAVVSSLFSSYFLKPISETVDALQKLSMGEFSTRLTVSKRDSNHIRELKEAVNKTAAELGSTEVMRNDFINVISHEYKTPVASILGYAKILKNPSVSSEDKEKYTDIIIDESRRLSSMTNNILLLTKFENTEIIPDKKPYALDEQLRSCVQLLSSQWLEKGINIEGDLSPVTYFGNSDLMAHIWINLLDNAIKHTDENGTVSVTLNEEKDNIEIKITDTGNGIRSENIEHIFDRFYQEDESRNVGGNGLGLSIVKRLVELCKGKITVQSEVGKGTCFTVFLPKEN
ncbi:MAG: sensor histidine kinase [Eubacterium sp.]